MVMMAGMSIYLVALVIVRLNFFRKIKADSQKLMEQAHEALSKHDQKAIAALKGQRTDDPPARILISAAFMHQDLNRSELSELFAVTRIRQGERVSKGLVIFGTLATIAPFVGLLGTVIGIVESFNGLAESGAAGPNVVATGVATALWATAAGLVVAIPSVIAYNVFRSKAKAIMIDMEVVSRELLAVLKPEAPAKLKAI
jgi:biopolymer transport protein ExbB